ncbi:MAG: hypothetical protein QOG58_6037 [Caballeronia sp.]|nr:hypothetical protein [Caballeronia sp.]
MGENRALAPDQRRPIDVIESAEGMVVLKTLLVRMGYGIYPVICVQHLNPKQLVRRCPTRRHEGMKKQLPRQKRDFCHLPLSQRAAASAVSSGRVLNAMDALGAHL